LCQILMYFGCFLLLFGPLYGTLDRIGIYVGYAWLTRTLLGLQHNHLLLLLAVLKRLRLMNQGLRQLHDLNFNIVETRRFVRWTTGCSVKIFHHLHHITEITSLTFSMVSNILKLRHFWYLMNIFILTGDCYRGCHAFGPNIRLVVIVSLLDTKAYFLQFRIVFGALARIVWSFPNWINVLHRSLWSILFSAFCNFY
jgi:hypothetical protein